jgi:hypothetical protein
MGGMNYFCCCALCSSMPLRKANWSNGQLVEKCKIQFYRIILLCGYSGTYLYYIHWGAKVLEQGDGKNILMNIS